MLIPNNKDLRLMDVKFGKFALSFKKPDSVEQKIMFLSKIRILVILLPNLRLKRILLQNKPLPVYLFAVQV